MRLQTPALVVLIALTALPVAASASQANGSAGALVRPAQKSSRDADRKNPYSKLFKPAPYSPPLVAPAAATPAEPEIKCGMTMIPVDPSGYPGIVMPQESRSTKYSIRAIDPPLCR